MMERALSEVLDSQAKMLERTSPLASSRGGKPDSALMASAFESVLGRVDQFISESPNIRVLRIAHRTVVENPRSAAQAVAEHLADSGTDIDLSSRDLSSRLEEMVSVVMPDLYRARGSEGI